MNYEEEDDGFAYWREAVWKLERVAKKSGGFLKIVPARPTKLKAYAAKMYRACSVMSFVDLENVVPGTGEVCCFTEKSWTTMPLWDVWQTLTSKAKGRLALAVIVGDSFREESGHALVFNPREIARL